MLLYRLQLPGLGFFLFQLGSLEALAIECNFGNAYGGKCLAMSTQLFVLLLAFVVEDQNLRAPAFFDHVADNPRFGLRLANLAFCAGDRQHFGELHVTVRTSTDLLDSNYIPGRHPVLLATGADDREHASASVKMSRNQLETQSGYAHERNRGAC